MDNITKQILELLDSNNLEVKNCIHFIKYNKTTK